MWSAEQRADRCLTPVGSFALSFNVCYNQSRSRKKEVIVLIVEVTEKVCNMDCFNCPFSDCINEDEATIAERDFSTEIDKDSKPKLIVDMTRYIHNRVDKEDYTKARDREYEKKRGYTPKRKEQKHQQYLRHREAKLSYQKTYYEAHKEEILARQRQKYKEKKEKEVEQL